MSEETKIYTQAELDAAVAETWKKAIEIAKTHEDHQGICHQAIITLLEAAAKQKE